jgi:ribosome-binding protein aMBF1 (putative translation factor)
MAGLMAHNVTDAAIWRRIGARIKQRRRALCLSRADLADRVDLRVAQITQIEDGTMLPTTTWLKAIALALGITDVQQFYGPQINIVIEERPDTETEIRSLIGENIYQRRRALGLSRNALAGRLNMTGRMIETIETGAVSMRAEIAPAMCEALGFVDVRQLYAKDGDRQSLR